MLTYFLIFPIILLWWLPQIGKEDSILILNILMILILLVWIYVIGNIIYRIQQLKRL